MGSMFFLELFEEEEEVPMMGGERGREKWGGRGE